MRENPGYRLGTTEEPHPAIAEKLLQILWNESRLHGEAGLRKMAERIFAWQDRWHLFKALGVNERGHPSIELNPPIGDRSADPTIPPPYRIVHREEDFDRILPDYQRLREAMLEGGYEAFKKEWVELMGPLPEGMAGGGREEMDYER
jgi:hypothetical protein